MTYTSEPGIPTGERPYQMFEITVQCNACGMQFTRQQGDQNANHAAINVKAGLILSHGHGLDDSGEVEKCPSQGGIKADGYTLVSCTPIANQ